MTDKKLYLNSPHSSGPFSIFLRGEIKFDLAKSILQKSIRRNIPLLAVIILNRILEASYYLKNKGIKTNLLNRLIVIAGEDIGGGNLNIIKEVEKCVEESREIDDLEEDQNLLSPLVFSMCKCYKSRAVSHWRSFYYKPTDTLKPNTFEKFVQNFQNGNKKCVKYAMIMQKSDEKMKIDRYNIVTQKTRKIDSPIVYLIWNYLLKFKDQYINILYKWFCEHWKNDQKRGETDIYLLLAIISKTVNCNLTPISELNDENYSEILKYIDNSFNYDFTIPDFMIDKHTSQGREMGKSSKEFAEIGSIVEPIYQPLFDKEMYDHYIKVRSGEIEKSDEKKYKTMSTKEFGKKLTELIDIVEDKLNGDKLNGDKLNGNRNNEDIISQKTSDDSELYLLNCQCQDLLNGIVGQKITASWKPYLFISSFDSYVYKGPFKTTGKQMNVIDNYIKFCDYFEMLGSGKNIIKGEKANSSLGYFLRMKNIATTQRHEWKYEKEDNLKILVRSSLGYDQLSKFDDNIIFEQFFGDNFLFGTVMDCAFLGRGDVGIWNMLYIPKEKKTYLIDFDNDSSRKEITQSDDFFAKRSKNMKKIVDDGLKSNKEKIMKKLKIYKDKIKNIPIEGIEKNLEMIQNFIMSFYDQEFY